MSTNNGNKKGNGKSYQHRAWRKMEPDERNLNDQLHKMYKTIILPQEMKQIRYDVSKKIEQLLDSNYPNFMFKAVIYGSTEYGLCLIDGDLDLCLLSYSFTEVTSTMLHTFADLLKENNFEIILVIPTARIPIIKMIDLETNTHIDLSFNQSTPTMHSEFFTTMVNCIDPFKRVTVLLKHWLKMRNLNCPFQGGLSSAALCFMIIHYFISLDPPLFPNDYTQTYFPMIQINATRLSTQLANKYSTAYLVKGFFEYYKSFDFDELIIPTTIPIPSDYFAIPAVINVLDPITFQNCAKSVSTEGLKTFKMEVIRAFKLLNDENDFAKVLENPVPFPQN